MSALAVSFDGAASPVMLTTREIADATQKFHMHVIRDAKAMIIALYAENIVDRMIPPSMRSKPSVFIRENADAILCELSGDEPNWVHPSGGVAWTRDVRGYIANITMDENHALTLVTGYDVVKRKALVDMCARLRAERRQPDPHAARIASLEARVAALEAKPALRLPAKPGAAERILEFVRKRGEVTKSEILRQFRDVSAAECGAALARLQADGRLVVVMVASSNGKAGGRHAAHCRWVQ